MNHYPNQDRDIHSRRSAIELPYPGSPSPPQSKTSAQQNRAPELRRAESIASYHSHQSRQERERYDQRPITPPADPLTPPMSRRGSLDLNDQLHPSHVPQQYHQYDPQDYPKPDDSSVNFTPPSSTGTVFNAQNPPSDNARPPRGGTNPYAERVPNPLIGFLNKVIRDSSDSGYERVEYYDPQGRLTDANGTVIIDEPEHVPHESRDRKYDQDDETDRRYRQQVNTTDAPSINHYPESLLLKERYARATRDDGDQTPRQRSPIAPRTEHQENRDTRPSRIDTLRESYGLDLRLRHHVQEDRDTRYDPSISHATIQYAKRDRVSNLKPPNQPEHGSTRSYKRDLSPTQSISSFSSRYSDHSHHAKEPHRASHKQESSESSRRSLSPVKRDRTQNYQSTKTRDRSLNPVARYQSHKHRSERSRRSISPPRKNHSRRDVQTRSPDFSSSSSESDYSTPRRSKSGDSKVIMMMFSSKSRSKTSRSQDSDDSWDKKTFSGPSPVGRTLAPLELARRERAKSRAEMASAFRVLADKIERGSDDGTTMRVVSLRD